jgi:hypothetical protein
MERLDLTVTVVTKVESEDDGRWGEFGEVGCC